MSINSASNFRSDSALLLSPYLKKNQRIIYFNAVIKPLLMYASAVWTSCNKEVLGRVLRMQKRAARIILEAQRKSRTVTLFNNLSWIPFYNEAYIKRCELAFKRINGSQLPDYLSASLRKNSDVHSRNTRNCDVNLLCPLHRNISEGGRTFAVRTVKAWNNLPRSLKTRSLKSFKAELWKVVLNSQKSKGSFDLN